MDRPIGILLICSCCSVVCARGPASRPVSTMTFERPKPICVEGRAIDLRNHAATRCFDWDGDGDVDLLVGGGDGRLWLFRNVGVPKKIRFRKPELIHAGTRQYWGNSCTGVALANLAGNRLPDLIVCHSDNLITIHTNIGRFRHPRFAEAGLTFQVQKGCHGRFDVADWNGDGLADVIVAAFRLEPNPK